LLASNVLTIAHIRSANSSTSAVSGLVVGCWLGLGAVVVLAVACTFCLFRMQEATKRPQFGWMVWTLSVVAAVDVSLWAVYAGGTATLGWVVPTLGTILVTLFTIWHPQVGQKSAPASTESIASGKDESSSSSHTQTMVEQKHTVTVLVPKGLRRESGIDRDSLVDARGKAQSLENAVKDLHQSIKAAVASFGPDEDWRILLAGPQDELDSCCKLIDQLHQLPRPWANIGKWSFEFTDRLNAISRAAAELDKVIEDAPTKASSPVNLVNSAARLDNLVHDLTDFIERAMESP